MTASTQTKPTGKPTVKPGTQPVTVPADEKPDVSRTQSNKIDWNTVTVEDTGKPVTTLRVSNKFKRLDGTPFEAAVKSSHEAGTAKSITVKDESAAKEVTYLLRLAAEKTGLGVRIPTPFKKDDAGNLVILFQGAKRRVTSGPRKPSKQRAGESDADWQARKSAWETATGQTWVASK